MKAYTYIERGKFALTDKSIPVIQEPTDAIVRVTLGSICTSDLHIKNGSVPKAVPGITVGHEMVGIVEETGSSVKNVKAELYKNVVLASIVEREYRIDSEAPLIASVFRNRLKHGIGLYSCATIEYIITEVQGKPHPDVITYADLSIDSPYNTYKWAGLPPGPISNPGAVALDAAINSPKTDYYFFRLVDAKAGRHVFSKDFSTHVNEGYIYSTKKSGN